VGLDYQLITNIIGRKHGTFHCHSTLLDQVLTCWSRQHEITESVWSSFLWLVLTLVIIVTILNDKVHECCKEMVVT